LTAQSGQKSCQPCDTQLRFAGPANYRCHVARRNEGAAGARATHILTSLFVLLPAPMTTTP